MKSRVSAYLKSLSVKILARGRLFCRTWPAFLAALVCLTVSAGPGNAAEAPYSLGAFDKVRIYVHEWPVLTGEFTINGEGQLSLPLIGAVPAAGLQTTELSAAVAGQVQKQADLARPPATSVDIIQYRPFYILGAVERQGEYPYRPGMTVLNAVSIAGGLYRTRGVTSWTFERDAISGAGDLRVLAIKRAELSAKQARLEAEAKGLETVSFPQDDDSTMDSAEDAQAKTGFSEHERSLFNARLEKFKHQLATLQRTIELYQQEIRALEEQIAAEEELAKGVQKELDVLNSLIAKGLAPTSRLPLLEQLLGQINRERQNFATAIVRAKQQINQTEQAIASLRDERTTTALDELRGVRSALLENAQRTQTVQRLLIGSLGALPDARRQQETDGYPAVSYTITRPGPDGEREIAAGESTRVEPGDILKVHVAFDRPAAQIDVPLDRETTSSIGNGAATADPVTR